MGVKTGTSSIQVASFKYTETLLQDNYILCLTMLYNYYTLKRFMDSVATGILSSLFEH